MMVEGAILTTAIPLDPSEFIYGVHLTAGCFINRVLVPNAYGDWLEHAGKMSVLGETSFKGGSFQIFRLELKPSGTPLIEVGGDSGE